MQWTLSTYALQVIVPDRIRGRIFAFDEALISVTIAASATLAGWAAEYVNVRIVLFGLALVACAYALVWTAATTKVRRSLTAPIVERASARAQPAGGAGGEDPGPGESGGSGEPPAGPDPAVGGAS